MPLPRWIDIIIIGTISFIIFSALTAFLIKPSDVNNWIAFIHKLPTHTHYSLLILSGIIIQRLLHSVGDFTFNNFIKNPPLWVAVFLPIVLIYMFDIEHKGVGMNSRFYFSLLPITLGLLFLPFATWIFHRSNSWIMSLNKSTAREKNKNNQTPALIYWLYDESPICNSLHDKWDRTNIIDRVVSRLNSRKIYNRGGCLLGDYGSGKSSVISLIEEKLNNLPTKNKDNDWIICRFDSWGRIDNAQQAQGLILEKMIESISEHTSISALNNLPQRYLDALQGNDAWWNTLFSIFNASSLDPESQLGKVDNILSAIDKKLLLVIEDLDRNTDCNKLSLEIVPLLDRLRELKQVNFIITLGHEKSLSSTITRITSFREDLTNHEHEKLDFILKEFRDFCLKDTAKEDRYIDGVIDRAYWPLVDGKAGVVDGVSYQTSSMQGSIYHAAYLAIKHYLSNPRTLKYCLRSAHSAWDKIHGEINFDDLLCFNVIKQSEPYAFDFIIKNINILIASPHITLEGGDKSYIDYVIEDDRVNDPKHLYSLMQFLFPRLVHPSKTRDILSMQCLQLIGDDINYFKLATNPVLIKEQSERNLLNHITHDGEIPELYTNSIQWTTDKIIKFSRLIYRENGECSMFNIYKTIIEKLVQESENDRNAIRWIGQAFSSLFSVHKMYCSTTNNCHCDYQGLLTDTRNSLIKTNIVNFFDFLSIIQNEQNYIKPLSVEINIFPDFTNAHPLLSNNKLRQYDEEIISFLITVIHPKMKFGNEVFQWIMSAESNEIKIKYLSQIFKPGDGIYYFNKEQASKINDFVDGIPKQDRSTFTTETSNQLIKLKELISEFIRYINQTQDNESQHENHDETVNLER